MRVIEKSQIVEGWPIVDLQTAANNGDYVSLKLYGHVTVIFMASVGTAGDDPTLTLQQAQDVAGTGVKALTFTTIHKKQAATNLSTTGQFTKVTQAAATSYTDLTSAELDKIWVVEFDAQDLDVDNGFDCLRATVADVGGNAQLGTLLYFLSEPRYPEDLPASAIVD